MGNCNNFLYFYCFKVVKLEHHLGQLHQEKRKRLDQFYRSKKEINELFGLLERNAQDDLELLMTDSNDEIDANNVISSSGIKAFSRRTLKALQDLERNCIHQLEANKAQGDTLWQKIRELWSRLSADDEMMLVFTQVHRPISKGTWEDIYKPSVLKGVSFTEWFALILQRSRFLYIIVLMFYLFEKLLLIASEGTRKIRRRKEDEHVSFHHAVSGRAL